MTVQYDGGPIRRLTRVDFAREDTMRNFIAEEERTVRKVASYATSTEEYLSCRVPCRRKTNGFMLSRTAAQYCAKSLSFPSALFVAGPNGGPSVNNQDFVLENCGRVWWCLERDGLELRNFWSRALARHLFTSQMHAPIL